MYAQKMLIKKIVKKIEKKCLKKICHKKFITKLISATLFLPCQHSSRGWGEMKKIAHAHSALIQNVTILTKLRENKYLILLAIL